MTESPYSPREIRALIDSVNELKKEVGDHIGRVNKYIQDDSIAHANIMASVENMKSELDENTSFRKKVVSSIVGTAFLALCALGVGLLKITGVLNLK